eukprot:865402-Pelagomonas_calceolata.AAC.1
MQSCVERQITAKQAHVEVLRVQNWIPSPQRFAVNIERKRADKATTLQGPTYLDVPALSAKDYKLNVYRCAGSWLTVDRDIDKARNRLIQLADATVGFSCTLAVVQ